MRRDESRKTGYPLQLEVDIPLQQGTDSANAVASLVKRLLGDISQVESKTSHRDILQALTIAASVRLAMARANVNRKHGACVDLLDATAV